MRGHGRPNTDKLAGKGTTRETEMSRFNDRVCIITGGASGLGLADLN